MKIASEYSKGIFNFKSGLEGVGEERRGGPEIWRLFR